MRSQVLGFHQLLWHLQAVRRNMCATSVAKFSAEMIHLHITRASIRGKPGVPFVINCFLGNTLWCHIFQLSMALNISPDNFNGALSQLCELIFYIIFIGGRFVFICVTDAFHAHIFFWPIVTCLMDWVIESGSVNSVCSWEHIKRLIRCMKQEEYVKEQKKLYVSINYILLLDKCM
jgi:hypothetical protein